MARKPTKMVDGVVVDATDADLAQMETDRIAAANRPRLAPPFFVIVQRLQAAGKYSAFASRLMLSPDILVMVLAKPGIIDDTQALRSLISAAGADPNTILG